MGGARLVSVSAAMERGGITLSGVDANTDMPLVGATVSLYQGTSLKASAVITAVPVKNPYTGVVIGASFTSWADLINLPAPGGTGATYTPKISLTNYTASAQNAFDTWYNTNGTVYPFGGLGYLPGRRCRKSRPTSPWSGKPSAPMPQPGRLAAGHSAHVSL